MCDRITRWVNLPVFAGPGPAHRGPGVQSLPSAGDLSAHPVKTYIGHKDGVPVDQ
ncbi:hypothetical protein F750_4429 [Streptomyces sp. PAMC 26508]|nr:hypothetical protein F750_4429 [Streptomyces sp. PAMC 26508]